MLFPLKVESFEITAICVPPVTDRFLLLVHTPEGWGSRGPSVARAKKNRPPLADLINLWLSNLLCRHFHLLQCQFATL